MNTKPKGLTYPCRAWIVRLMAAENYSDSISVESCTAEKKVGDLVEVSVRCGSAVERRRVPVSELASSEARALAKFNLALHALAARPLPSPVAGMTAASACKVQASAA